MRGDELPGPEVAQLVGRCWDWDPRAHTLHLTLPVPACAPSLGDQSPPLQGQQPEPRHCESQYWESHISTGSTVPPVSVLCPPARCVGRDLRSDSTLGQWLEAKLRDVKSFTPGGTAPRWLSLNPNPGRPDPEACVLPFSLGWPGRGPPPFLQPPASGVVPDSWHNGPSSPTPASPAVFPGGGVSAPSGDMATALPS